MAINTDFIGRAFPPGEPYEVSRVKLAEFADAIGDPSPVYRDRAAAQEAGYPDVVAPPTFPIVITLASSERLIAMPELNINYAMVVHGEQRFEYARPIFAGDVLTAQVTITEIRNVRSNWMLTTVTSIDTVDGEHVCTAHSTAVERGAG